MTEVQSVLFDEELLQELTQSLLNAYINYESYEENQFIDNATPLDFETSPPIKQFFNIIVRIFNQLINTIKEIYLNIKEILPEFFDKFIESILLYSKETKNKVFTTFKQIYDIFQFFGLEEIYPKTFDKINASLQWKICSPDFITLDFIKSYKNSLLSNISRETINSIDDLISILLVFEKEKRNNIKLEKDISKILN